MEATRERPLMRIAEVAEILGVGNQRVYELIYAGVIPHSRITPRSIRVPRGAFVDWLAEQNRAARESIRAGPPVLDEPADTQVAA